MRKTHRRFVSLALILTAVVLRAPSSEAATLQCRQLPQLFEAYFRSHYAMKSMTDTVKAHTIEQFIKGLDPSKTVLLESDVAKLRKDLPAMFSSMRSGDCSALDSAEQLLVQRSQENEDFVRSFLGANYKLDESTELILDPEKRGFPKTAEEKQGLLKKYVHFQISNYLLTDMKLPEAKKQLVHRYELATKRAKEDRAKDVIISYAEAFALSLDPHSSFMSKETLEDFRISMDASLEGIGASLSYEDGFTVVEDTIPGGGAARSKVLRPKDKIISVAQEKQKPVSVIDMDLRDVVNMIRGRKGTKVTLTILRQGQKTETFDVTIVRDKIDIKDQLASISYETRKAGDKKVKIGVLELPSFYGGNEGGHSSYEDVKKLLLEAKKEKVDGIVLNLSRNGGGLLEDAVKIVGLFIHKGGVVGTKDSDGHVEILADEDETVVWSGPLAVLTSRLSASASEIVAGALKDYHRAVIIGGDHTFGKGTVQKLAGLPLDLGGMKVTIGMFFLPGGESTQHLGVASDVLLPSLMNSDDIGEVKMDYSLPPQRIQPFLTSDANLPAPPAGVVLAADSPELKSRWIPVNETLTRKLAEASAQRVAKDPKFTEIKKEIEETARNKGIARLAELRKKAQAENKADKKKNRKERVKDLESPFIREGANIMADMIALESGGAIQANLLSSETRRVDLKQN